MPIVILHGPNDQISAGKGEVVVTAAQAAARLGVSASRIRQMVASGVLTPVGERLHGADLYREIDVEQVRADREAMFRRETA